jgi:hypothetical protein
VPPCRQDVKRAPSGSVSLEASRAKLQSRTVVEIPDFYYRAEVSSSPASIGTSEQKYWLFGPVKSLRRLEGPRCYDGFEAYGQPSTETARPSTSSSRAKLRGKFISN